MQSLGSLYLNFKSKQFINVQFHFHLQSHNKRKRARDFAIRPKKIILFVDPILLLLCKLHQRVAMAIKPIHQSSSRNELMTVHLLCGIALLSPLLISQNTPVLNLINQPVKTISLLWAVQGPAGILAYSRIRANPYGGPIGRGLVSIPAGALVNAIGAIVFGAPLGLEYAARTLHWSLLMSSLTVVPAATVFGISWPDWQRIFAHIKLLGGIDYALCFPAYGAVIGAWFGAWPMPLDWERPWQEWPICVTYGAIGGYLLGLMASGIANILNSRCLSGKTE